MRGIGIATAAVLLFGCSTTTTIHSSPPGAKLYLDGVYRGETPITMSLPDGTDHGYKRLRLEKEGHLPLDAALGRRQDGGRLVCGYFCLFPLLWMYKWDDSYSFTLEPQGTTAAQPTPSSP